MVSKRNKILKLIVLCIVFVGGMFLFGGKAYGVSKDELQKRAFANNLNRCYNGDFLNQEVSFYESDTKLNFSKLEAGGNPLVYDPYGTGEGSIYMRCKELFVPSETHNGRTILSVFGKPELIDKDGAITGISNVASFLEYTGYEEFSSNKSDRTCYKFYLAEKNTTGYNPYLLYADICIGDDGEPYFFNPDGADSYISGVKDYDELKLTFLRKTYTGEATWRWYKYTKDENGAPITDSGRCSWKIGSTDRIHCAYYDWAPVKYTVKSFTYGIPPKTEPDYKEAYEKTREWLTGEKTDVKPFSETDIMTLYYSYIRDVLSHSYDDDDNCKESKPDKLYDGDKKIFYTYNGSRWCNGSYKEEALTMKFPGFNLNGGPYVYMDKMLSFEDLLNDLAYLMDKNPDAIAEVIGEVEAERKKDQGEPPKEQDDKCYTDGSAIGWMLCPAIAATTGAGQWMYDEVEKQLRVDVDIFKDDGGLVSGWKIILNIANTVFIILFLVVIFSQLTGVGINNYGIKKILPKLIIVAILVNLSLILCELAVDLSNIAGTGLRGLFQGMAASIQQSEAATELTKSVTGSEMFAGVMIGSLAGIGLVALYSFITSQKITQAAVGLLLALLGAIIVVVVAILVIFLILMIRQTGIIILVVLAPLAIVCYALPNTEKLAKKWLDLFKALLVVYPICGAMVGAGEFASKVLLNSSTPGNPLALAAMIVKVLPYFFVPMLLRRSLAMMGNVGARLSTIGRGLGRRGSTAARQGIRNSERYKDWEKYQNEQTAEARARRVHDRLINRGNLSNRQKNRLRKANEVLAAMTAQRAADANRSKESYLEASIVGSKKKFKDEEIENYMNLVNNRTNNGENETEFFNEYDDAIKTNNEAKAIAIARIAGRRKDTATSFVDKKFIQTSAEDRAAHADIFRSIAKEIATGANSASYRQSSPLQFEYAARINDGKASVSDSYDTWSQSRDNINAAIDHHITSAAELMGMKTSSLQELNKIAIESPNRISKTNAEVLQNAANNALALAEKDPNFPETKRKELERIIGWNLNNFVDSKNDNPKNNSSTNNTNGGGATGSNGRGRTDINI